MLFAPQSIECELIQLHARIDLFWPEMGYFNCFDVVLKHA
ncbi:hypothetical protein EV14_1297 [Prochlorococcus sp. MIT 0703]|nr:hypothetical protein EV14_1297 [Prochlorococcus sp. MIT 0703]